MAPQNPPKAVLFDIGGVCVLSPLQGILDFERKNGIPTDWINFAISHRSPNGYWQRLERGEIKMDKNFFQGFTSDLHNKDAWREFHSTFRNEKKKLKDTANPTQLGDHVSLKAEAADSTPTDQDKGSQSSQSSSSPETASSAATQKEEKPSLSKLAKDTTIGDPVSLESEEVQEVPDGDKATNDSSQQSKEPIVAPQSSPQGDGLPPMPQINGESLFWAMMSASREPDPYVFPALERLSKQRPRPIIGALSNTMIFPPDHPYSKASSPDLRSFFDVFVASAEVGMRKPSKDIYELAIKRLDEFDKQKGGSSVTAGDIVFLDDIGENLKTGREAGMRTIRVQLGKTWRAVKELEGVLNTELMDDKTRRSKL